MLIISILIGCRMTIKLTFIFLTFVFLLWDSLSMLMLACYVGTGCDWLAKVGSKNRVISSICDPDELSSVFINDLNDKGIKIIAEKYLVNVWSKAGDKVTCFDHLRNIDHQRTHLMLQLPPTSYTISVHRSGDDIG